MDGSVYTRVEAGLQGNSISVEIVDYRWVGVTCSSNRHADHTLSRRLAPGKLTSHMRIGTYDYVRNAKMAFVPAGLPILARTFGGHARFGICHFDPARFDRLMGTAHEWNTDSLRACGDIRSALLDNVVQQLIAEAACPGFASDVLVDALGDIAMVEVARHFGRVREQGRLVQGGLAPWQMRRITEHVQQCVNVPISISALAKLCGLSAGHLRRSFKQTASLTLHQYVEKVRLDRAKLLLGEGEMPLKQIAAELGFASASGFTIAFRRATGEAPSSFRRRILGDRNTRLPTEPEFGTTFN